MTTTAIHFVSSEKPCEFKGEESVLAVALNHGIQIPHSCGAMGSCTTCRVIVVSSKSPLPPRNELEADIAEMRGFSAHERLSCQLPPEDGMVLEIPAPQRDDFSRT